MYIVFELPFAPSGTLTMNWASPIAWINNTTHTLPNSSGVVWNAADNTLTLEMRLLTIPANWMERTDGHIAMPAWPAWTPGVPNITNTWFLMPWDCDDDCGACEDCL